MARIHYKHGYFHGLGSWDERTLFKQAGFRWSPVRKAWITDRQDIAESIRGIPWTNEALEFVSQREHTLRESYELSFAATTDFHPPVPPGLHPRTGKPFEYYPYQRAGIEYALQRKDTLIADQPGLGKSPMGIGVFNADPNARRALIVVPASLKENWRREFELWKTKDATVGIAETKKEIKEQVGVFKTGRRKGRPRYKTVDVIDLYWPDTDVVIINYDILQRFAEQINAQPWDLVICDEAHALKTEDSGRTLFVLGGKKKDKSTGWQTQWYNAVEANRRVFLTGTPMMNRPIELWPMLHAFDPQGLGRDKKDFGYRYCEGYWDQTLGGYDKDGRKKGDYNFSGASNLEELGEKLRSTCMIRRLRTDVLPELPPKSRHVVILDSPEIREAVAREDELAQTLKLYEQMVADAGLSPAEMIAREAKAGAEIADRADKMGFSDASDPDMKFAPRLLNMPFAQAITGLEPPAIQIAFEEMATVRRELGMAKLSAGVPWVRDYLDGGEKLIVFAYHTDVLKGLYAALKDSHGAVMIHGGISPNRRQGFVDNFQEDDWCRVILLQTDAGGVGYTLTRAKDVCFFEEDWRPTVLEQAFDRVCRIGQTADRLMGFQLTANGSLGCKIAQRAYEKEIGITATLDTRRPTVVH